MFIVYYQRSKYEMTARFYDLQEASNFAHNFITFCGGNFASITNSETGELVGTFEKFFRV